MSQQLKINDAARRQIEAKAIRQLELGCGAIKRYPHSIAIDALDLPVIDIVGDVFDALAAIPSGSVQGIHAAHFFEHIDDQALLISECGRVLAPGGVLEVTVPHFSNPFFYSDYTHKRAFGLYSMSYLVRDNLFRRKVPSYGKAMDLELIDVKLTFKSARKYSIRNVVLRLIGILANIGRYTQELYEEIYTKFVPCYEITYFCQKQSGSA